MADETIIDKAVALIPGVGASKRKTTAAQRHKQLQAIQKKLATLARDVEKLAAHIADEAKDAVGARPAARKPAARKPAARTAAATKPAAAAKKPAQGRKPASAPRRKPSPARKTAKAG